MQTAQLLILFLLAAAQGALLAAVLARAARRQLSQDNERLRRELAEQLAASRQEASRSVQDSVVALGKTLTEAQRHSGELQDKRLAELNEQLTLRNDALQRTVATQLARVDARFESFTTQSEQKLEALRTDNARQLEQMRLTVDEKLQKTLDERLSQSFAQVSERLEQVYKGLGEMQTLASGVGDLKKVLSNVKSRGILGEIQLGAILEQILSPEQYAANVVTRRGSTNVVEFAVRMPGDGEREVWLPIDAKFPADTYAALMDAYEAGKPEQIASAGKELERRIRQCAKDICEKYIDPPNTTDFAILFLPFEGLYAEVVRRGLIEGLAREFRINIAGPTTMAALLNALQMGFQTLAIQKRSSEVWRVLSAVKTEFANFSQVLEKAQTRLRQTNEDLDRLIGTRTRAIVRRLRDVAELPGDQAQALLELPAPDDGE